ncbi:MAG: BlaB/IND/MUS family subclass B1 metallo-beta-lactamase [Bacteroidetes bacterium]|nr:BlaB/IND/MUS family subclass B1 metallo-beta-lactamase [Bacteroidota bacterium]
MFLSVAYAQNTPLQITHLTGNCYIFTTFHDYKGSAVSANGMYMVTDAGVVLCDTPWDTTQCKPLCDSIFRRHQQKVVLCISTHAHEDRTGGLPFFRRYGARTYTSVFTDSLCRIKKEHRAEFLFKNDTVFRVGEQTIQTYYPGPGHAPDNIVLWIKNAGILYGGCFIKSTEATDLGNLGDANTNAWPQSIQNVKRKFRNPAYVIPGHQGWANKASLDHTLMLLRKYKAK